MDGGERRHGREPFFFGVPLIARSRAADWGRVGDLLELTLRSTLAQTDGAFTLLLAGHDVPEGWDRLVRGDRRFRFLRAGWDPAAPTRANDDGGAKKSMIVRAVRRAGGGLLMYLDADDLVDRRTVEVARAGIRREHVGGIAERGIMLDFRTLRAGALPMPGVYDGAFVELCGSSTVARIDPASPDPARRDPHAALGSHHLWPRAAAEAGLALARLPLMGAYVVNTDQNHSETHGPFAAWRRRLNAALAREGAPLDRVTAARFGVTLDLLAAKSCALPIDR
ncbi:MAG TPA: hypothetical protein VFJ13_12065 [Paracoccaceae bacterium]|nr:hypothetical protein [Paracoccaceae bacterium]